MNHSHDPALRITPTVEATPRLHARWREVLRRVWVRRARGVREVSRRTRGQDDGSGQTDMDDGRGSARQRQMSRAGALLQ